MTEINVQFSDAGETEIVSVFASPQDSEHHENLGDVASGDARYVAFYERTPIWARASLIAPGG